VADLIIGCQMEHKRRFLLIYLLRLLQLWTLKN